MKSLSKAIATLLLFAFLIIPGSQVAEAQTPIQVPTPLSPTNGSSVDIATPAFAWSSVVATSTAILYDLQISSSSSMTAPLVNKTNLATNSYALSAAEALLSGTYWWQVRARDSATPSFNYSNWSSPPWSLTINIAPAPTPTPAPAPTPVPTPAPTISPSPQLRGFFGQVKAVSTTTLTIGTRSEHGGTGDIELLISANTRVMAPPIQLASASDIKTGDRIAVLAQLSGDKYSALQIVIIPTHLIKKHIQGLVMEVKESQVTLIERNGKAVILQLTQGVTAPAVGQFIIATVEENPATKQMRLLTFEASDKLLERLQGHAGKIEGQKPKNEAEEKDKGKKLEKLEDILNNNAERHIQRLEQVIEKAPPQAKPALEKVLEKAKQRQGEIEDKLDKTRGKGRGRGRH